MRQHGPIDRAPDAHATQMAQVVELALLLAAATFLCGPRATGAYGRTPITDVGGARAALVFKVVGVPAIGISFGSVDKQMALCELVVASRRLDELTSPAVTAPATPESQMSSVGSTGNARIRLKRLQLGSDAVSFNYFSALSSIAAAREYKEARGWRGEAVRLSVGGAVDTADGGDVSRGCGGGRIGSDTRGTRAG